MRLFLDRFSRASLMAVIFASVASMTVLILATAVPAFENSDEFNHFDRADQVAGGGLLGRRYGVPATSGGRADPGIDAIDHVIGTIRFHGDSKVTAGMIARVASIGWGRRTNMSFGNTSIYAPIFYIPAAAAIELGRMSHLSITRTLTLARMASGLIDVALGALAIALAGQAAPLLFVLLSLPMSLSLFGAVSQDGLMLAAAALACALFHRSRTDRGRDVTRRMLLAGVAIAILCIGRPAYVPLIAALLLFPGAGRRLRLAIASACLAVTFCWSALSAATAMVNGSAFRGVDPARQLTRLLLHPARWWSIVEQTMAGRQGMEGLSYFKEFVGVLGWLDVVLPGWFYVIAAVALVISTVAVSLRTASPLDMRGQGYVFLAATASVALVFVLLYLTWTPLGLPFVDGVQGRYFLPVALFLPVFLPMIRLPSRSRIRQALTVVVLPFPVLSAAVAVISVFHRYYI